MRLIFTFFLTAAALASAADLSGRWQFEGDVSGNPVGMECALKQDGDKLAGTCKSADGSQFTLEGKVTGANIAFSYSVDYQGTSYTLQYTGKLDDAGTGLTGSIEVAGTGGAFAAKKL